MFNETETVISVCNGEFFNFRQLRGELEVKGHRFNTQCDTEILTHLFEEYGPQLVNKLNGQFAFAVYDRPNRSLFLARDHIGINPLFYTVINGVFFVRF